MTPENSIRAKMWITDDGRYLTVDEITNDHLHNIRIMLCADMPRRGRVQRRFAAAWIQIIDEELTIRLPARSQA